MANQNRREHRKSSMNMADLEAINEQQPYTKENSGKYSEHTEIFEDICQETEAEDNARSTKQPRRLSGSDEVDMLPPPPPKIRNDPRQRRHSSYFMPPPEIRNLHLRRHSSYEPRNRSAHHQAHAELKDHLDHLEDKHDLRRASFVHNLLEFNLSFDVSMNSFADIGPSAALNLSCPVLSYMNDDEEDSVELNLLRRPSLVSGQENSKEESWESLKDDGEAELPKEDHENSGEYCIELPPLEEVIKPAGKRRRSSSYKILEKRLQLESPIEVLKSFNIKENSANFDDACITAIQPKNLDAQSTALDNEMHDTFQQQREQPAATLQQVARGA